MSVLQQFRQKTGYKFKFPDEETLKQQLAKSKTVYVGNMSFYTKEEQIHELFSKCGEIKIIIMGLHRYKKTPCGFCFIEEDAEDAVKYMNGIKLDERKIYVDMDYGFVEGRQYGRGRSGGQARDEYRNEYDEGRSLPKMKYYSSRYERGYQRSYSRRYEPYSRRDSNERVRDYDEGDKNPRFRERDDSDDETIE